MISLSTGEPFDSQPSELAGLRILVVEDSWEVSTGLKTLLEACGAEVVGLAATADNAKLLLSEKMPDVALVDINLRAGERSYGLIDKIRSLNVPVVVITGYADTSSVIGNVVAVLQKPFSEGELLAALRSVKRS